MEINWGLVKDIAVPLVALALGKFLDSWLLKKPKLISYLGHVSAFTLHDDKKTVIHTHAVVIRNAGRVSATNVRIGHHYLPENYQLFPNVAHNIEKTETGGGEIIIPKLVSGEQVTISYLYFPPLTYAQINLYTKSDEGFAKILTVIPTPQLPKWIIRLIWILMFVGVVSILYAIVELIRWIVSH
ncbi:MAG: hypothetical protein ABII09_04300 [Planctomycetota bacterium]